MLLKEFDTPFIIIKLPLHAILDVEQRSHVISIRLDPYCLPYFKQLIFRTYLTMLMLRRVKLLHNLDRHGRKKLQTVIASVFQRDIFLNFANNWLQLIAFKRELSVTHDFCQSRKCMSRTSSVWWHSSPKAHGIIRRWENCMACSFKFFIFSCWNA